MKIALTQALTFLETGRVRALVCYGSDEGVIRGVVDEIANSMTHTCVPSDSLAAYRDEVGTPTLFGDKPRLTVVTGAMAPAGAFKILQEWPEGFCVIATAKSCPPALVRHPTVGAVACYSCTVPESLTMLRRQAGGVVMTQDLWTRAAQQTRDGSWRRVGIMLQLWEGQVTAEVIDALTSGPGTTSQVLAVLGQRPVVLGPLEVEPIVQVRAWQRVVVQTLRLRQAYVRGLRGAEALRWVTPAIFYPHQEAIVAAAQRFSEDALQRKLGALLALEVRLKSDGANADISLQEFMLGEIEGADAGRGARQKFYTQG